MSGTFVLIPSLEMGKEYDAYLVISGLDVPPVAVGPFPDGYNALREWPMPDGYDTAESYPTSDEADEAVARIRAHMKGGAA